MPATAARLRWQAATITAIVPRTPRIKSYMLALAEPFAFRAGQHVDVRLTAPDGYQAQRSYSIASAPGADGAIELAVERLDDGEVSPFFHDVAMVGDEIELRGPIGGHFVWTAEQGGPVLLIGGGSGVVPLMSMARYRRAVGSNIPMLLLFSARTGNDVVWQDELQSLAEANDGFRLALTLTREKTMRAGDFSRRVDQAMMADVLTRLPETPRHVFVCGSHRFVESATQGAIAAGVNRRSIATERFGGTL
jgi:ferredoxin-NADP reductase